MNFKIIAKPLALLLTTNGSKLKRTRAIRFYVNYQSTQATVYTKRISSKRSIKV